MKKEASFAALAAFVVAVLLAAVVYTRVVRPSGPLDWDEASHALQGFRAFASLKDGHLHRFIYDSYRLVYWPPLHAWYLAALYALFGVSAETARAGGLLALVAAAAVLAGAGSRLGGAVAGVTAALVFLLTPEVLLVSSRAMLEVPALFALALALAFFSRMTPEKGGIALGMSAAATYLTKSNYGVVLVFALVLTCAGGGLWKWRSVRSAALTLALVFVVWFAWLPKIPATLGALTLPLEGGPDRFSAAGLLFYPLALPRLAGSGPMFILWLGTLIVALASGRLTSDPTSRFLVLLVFVQMGLAELTANKLDRHILPLVPAFALLAGQQVSRAFAALRPRARISGVAFALAAAGFLLSVALRSLTPASPDGAAILARLLSRASSAPRTLYLTSSDAPVAPAATDFVLTASGRMPVEGCGSLVAASELRTIDSLARQSPKGPSSPVRWLFAQGGRWPGEGSYSAHLGLPSGDPNYRWVPANLGDRLADVFSRAPVERVVVMPGSGRVYPGATAEFFARTLAPLGFTLEPAEEADKAILTFRRERVAAAGPLFPSAGRTPHPPEGLSTSGR